MGLEPCMLPDGEFSFVLIYATVTIDERQLSVCIVHIGQSALLACHFSYMGKRASALLV